MRWELGEEAKKSVPYSPGLVSSLRKAILVSAGVLVTALVFYPGCFSGDAQFSWNEAVSSGDLKFRDWHPPLIALAPLEYASAPAGSSLRQSVPRHGMPVLDQSGPGG